MLALADSLCSLARPSQEVVFALSNMTALPSPGIAASGTSGSLHGTSLHIQAISGFNSSSPMPISSPTNSNNKRKRRPAGTPDPDAEVVALSPKTLMESDRYVCEICNQGFQRDQNLQMHRRRHKVPWKLLKRPTPEVRKRVYVCPDPTCLHNDPCHALGDLVGIKKHFRRKHSIEKQWKCEKCSKGYAVQSDYKAHLKTCGTRGHSCDCGRVFSRVESFIEHQDNCNAAKERATFGYGDPPSLPSLTARTSSSNDTLSATRSGLSSAGIRPFDSGKFHEQPWFNIKQRELQFLPAKHHSETSGANNNGSAAGLIRDHIRIPTTDPRSSPATPMDPRYSNILSSSTEDNMSESGPGLQLSIGLSTDYEKKPHVKTNHAPMALTLLSAQDLSSSKEADHNETAARLINDTGTSGNISRDHTNEKTRDFEFSSGLFEALGYVTTRREPSEVTVGEGVLLNLPCKSARHDAIPAPLQPRADAAGSQSEGCERAEQVSASWSGIPAAHFARERDEAQSDIAGAELLKQQAREQLRHASAEKMYAEHARGLAKRQIELAEAEFATAKRIQEQARVQLAQAQLLREQATRRIDETRLEITCQACRQQFFYHIPPSNNNTNSNASALQLQLQLLPRYSSASDFSKYDLKKEL